MKTFAITRRLAMVAGSAALLGACSIIPRGADVPSRPIENAPLPEPTETGLPQDQDRHRIALLVPMSGDNGAVGQSIANATTMAILDTNATICGSPPTTRRPIRAMRRAGRWRMATS